MHLHQLDNDSDAADTAAPTATTTATATTAAAAESGQTDSANTPICISPTKKPHEPPDGGWGWVVVGASFVAHLIADGCGFSFGVLFSELLDVFGESKSRTAWVGSLFVSVPAICGPVASALTNRYGCRMTTIFGGIIGSFGCLLSAYANSIGQLCFTFGIVAGFGLSLVFVPAVVIVAFYFKKKRAFATGLAVAGSGIGTFIFAPLTELLIEHYQWRGALMITAGILLNIVVCGALFRPLDQVKGRILLNDNKSPDSIKTSAQWLLSSVAVMPHNMQLNGVAEESADAAAAGGDTVPPRFVSRSHPEFLLCAHVTRNDVDDDVIRRPCVVQSLILLPFREQSAKRSLETCSLLGTPVFRLSDGGHRLSIASFKGERCRFGSCDVTQFQSSHDFESLANRSRSFDSRQNRKDKDLVFQALPRTMTGNVVGMGHMGSAAYHRQKSGLSSSDRCVYLRRQDIVYRGSLLKAGFLLNNGRSASCPNVFVSSETPVDLRSRLRSIGKNIIGKMVNIVDLSVFRSTVFNYFCIHTVLLYVSYDIPYVYGPVRATMNGIAENYAPILVAIIGIFSTIGQVVMGYFGDQIWVNVLYFYNSMTSIAGLLTILVPFVFTFIPLSFLYAGYGFFISANFALTTVILVELLGMQKLTNAFGMVSLAQGIANLIGPPLAGWLSDVTGSYDAAFYGAGVTIFLSGLMLFAAPYLDLINGSSPLFRMTMNNLPVYLSDEVQAREPVQDRSGSISSNSFCKVLIEAPNTKQDNETHNRYIEGREKKDEIGEEKQKKGDEDDDEEEEGGSGRGRVGRRETGSESVGCSNAVDDSNFTSFVCIDGSLSETENNFHATKFVKQTELNVDTK